MSDVVTEIRPVSGLSKAALELLHAEIRQVYLGDERPWVLGFSGGKDSTTALQLVWSALLGLRPEQRVKRVYVISSDTLVETPMMAAYVDSMLEMMNAAAQKVGLPLTAHKVTPLIDDSFWVNLIGRGYPVPSTQFRWCTERLKISPANAFILDKVAEHGEVVVILGVRSSESSTRSQVMSLHRISGSHLSRHTTLPKAFVYTPIEHFSVDDVWTYLLQVRSPWGANNRDLVTLYRNAQAGECPLVVDKTTPSCGNSRFGCWVCTVVNRDASMEAMVENGEEWLEPLLEFRNQLASLQDSSIWSSIRRYKRRNGQVIEKEGTAQPWGPYTFDTRKNLLRQLFRTQEAMNSLSGQSAALILPEELEAIRKLWRTEEQDWADSVPAIYRETLGQDRDWIVYDSPVFEEEDKAILERICRKHEVNPSMVSKLIEVERSLQGMARRSSIQKQITSVLEEDWRLAEEFSSLPGNR